MLFDKNTVKIKRKRQQFATPDSYWNVKMTTGVKKRQLKKKRHKRETVHKISKKSSSTIGDMSTYVVTTTSPTDLPTQLSPTQTFMTRIENPPTTKATLTTAISTIGVMSTYADTTTSPADLPTQLSATQTFTTRTENPPTTTTTLTALNLTTTTTTLTALNLTTTTNPMSTVTEPAASQLNTTLNIKIKATFLGIQPASASLSLTPSTPTNVGINISNATDPIMRSQPKNTYEPTAIYNTTKEQTTAKNITFEPTQGLLSTFILQTTVPVKHTTTVPTTKVSSTIEPTTNRSKTTTVLTTTLLTVTSAATTTSRTVLVTKSLPMPTTNVLSTIEPTTNRNNTTTVLTTPLLSVTSSATTTSRTVLVTEILPSTTLSTIIETQKTPNITPESRLKLSTFILSTSAVKSLFDVTDHDKDAGDMLVVSEEAYESYKKKDYTQIDYLIDGMYADSEM
ncbi:hypothetical protein GDO86_008556 [Hymenochirus boettgeri]|nr:hypothetical protein GDO86_008556 [Hymenochirus boettgeri]